MDLGLKGKRALVLSSSRGLGRGIAEALAAEGADVLLTARTAERLDEAVAAINARGQGRAHAFAGPLKDNVEAIFAAAQEHLGGVDILIANTGGPPAGTALTVQPEAWTPQFEAMVTPVFRLAGLVLPGMRQSGFGRIVVVASSGVEQPIPNLVMSNALRASIAGWAKTLSAEVAADGVTVNMILPGRIETDRTGELDTANAKAQGKSREEIAEAARSAIPAKRYGKVQEFADVACFLASERASYVTGSMIRVDGGAVRSI
ncbi:SDR family oxidoreductase [Methylobacterium platani]|uniref:3-oxoacyl-ACP reductase n=2 Tax=Methylobacterium platani TaxID=427683 RepID=A0A179S575_9HYPH|nr:SDR family oxidoreductase [Methylobacterium platani]KMO11001.1 3-oxoacyl-ACP reductase [Methylobacterium platani JCM 14648]OAS20994.1 3-oxoacyl-ACP reductase [Methylobacterium platani]